jgi:DNA polymerase alpha subunit B
MSAEDLLYKWEALSYSSTRSLTTFTMDSALVLKTQIQRDITAENSRKQQAQARIGGLSGGMTRGRGLGSVRGINGAKAEIATRGKVPTRPAVKEEVGDVAGPSRVVFKGPKNNETLRKKRACE